jgi:hypothetical protein|tara:strand:- start:75 stop:428 length:354 start_codon:yes stop_codon:yes gene_type:complete
MAYAREFIKDTVLTHDEYYGFANAIAVIRGRWRITNTQYPNGFAYYPISAKLDLNSMAPDTYTAIADVTDAQLEAWCAAGMTANTITEIETSVLPIIKDKHELAALTTHYQIADAER